MEILKISPRINKQNLCQIGVHHTTFNLRKNSIKENDLVTNQKITHLDERTWRISKGQYNVFCEQWVIWYSTNEV